MGLAISSSEYAYYLKEDPEGAEWMEEDFNIINSALKKNGILEHSEATEVPDVAMSSIEGFPYSFLHYLRRVFALDKLGKPVTPTNGNLTTEDDNFIMEASEMLDSHLLCHSDTEGYYVPIDFDEVIFDEKLPGGMLGSSQRLFSEILKVAHLIGIEINGSEISESTHQELAKADESHPYYIERVVWFNLFENCQNSIENNTLISFG
ncbi:hypothetical protein [Spongorhabdus nitratireducens]